jgi:hypothetical protein
MIFTKITSGQPEEKGTCKFSHQTYIDYDGEEMAVSGYPTNCPGFHLTLTAMNSCRQPDSAP